jgi:hypothetical protein
MNFFPKDVAWQTSFFVISVFIFCLFEFVGGHGLLLMENSVCLPYLGCNVGFFGYDALVHFFAGVMEGSFIFWFVSKYPGKQFFHNNEYRKNLVIFISIVALMSVMWETLELIGDHTRTDILHMDVLHPRNELFQASNGDTMGDMFFGLLGALMMVYIVKKLKKDVLQAE